ncbi:GNAT family N-acetyltransferase [Streptomyces sp. SID4948]|nr:GNAT family N-acetyltransferase [Streptomyces sp. SID4948]
MDGPVGGPVGGPKAYAIPPVVPPGRMRGSRQPVLALPRGMRLRPWQDNDAPVLAASGLDADIQHWNRPGRLTLDGAREKIAHWQRRWASEAAAIWAVAPAETDGGGLAAVGLIGLADLDLRGGSGEILYWLLPAGRGGGVMTEAVRTVSRWAFEELGLHRLRITHSVANTASCAVATRAGFLLEGTMRSALLHADGWHDEHLHARIQDDRSTA